MNQIIIYPQEIAGPVLSSDETTTIKIMSGNRSWHIHHVLRSKAGDLLKVSLLNQGQGIAKVLESTPTFCLLELTQFAHRQRNSWCHLIVGLSRPPTMKKILEHASCMGVGSFHFFPAELSEKSYLQSKLWQEREYEKFLELGLSQSAHYFHLPDVFIYPNLSAMIKAVAPTLADTSAYVLHPYGTSFFSVKPFPSCHIPSGHTDRTGEMKFPPLYLAIGPERGWSPQEYQCFLERGFKGVKISAATLRVEMSVYYALAQLELLFASN